MIIVLKLTEMMFRVQAHSRIRSSFLVCGEMQPSYAAKRVKSIPLFITAQGSMDHKNAL